MGLRIATNVASMAVQRNLKKVSKESSDQLSKLSSGKRITKAADDAAGMAVASKLESQTRGLRQAVRNANDGVSMVQTAEGGLNEVSNILVRLRELSVQAASDTIGEVEKGFIDTEYQQLLEEVDRISQTTTFNGYKVLAGEAGGVLDFQVGTFSDENNQIQYDTDQTNATVSDLGVSGSGVSTKGDAQASIGSIDDALNIISGQRAQLGAVQSRLQSTVNNLETQALNQENAKSVIEDVDIAQSSAKLASANVIQHAGIATLAQANNLPNSAIKLIG